ncbi:MAG: dihydroorotate dehydrogenase electron transfer subunit [Candidatus Heimdallarchaeota archaeon]|nr:dihydroorotate dehydrogenase electron transfer subunit [Candidatus Heimdallarchaeota archaeon]
MTISKHGIQKVIPIDRVELVTSKDSRIPVKSFTLTIPEIAERASPGQFAMMWLYGMDEKPMGLASCNQIKGCITFAVAKIGKSTEAFHRLEEGDLLGIRGPFGKGFTLIGQKIAVIGGGTGIAPIRFLTEQALKKNIQVHLFHGARTIDELAFKNYFEDLAKTNVDFTYKPSTDDGSSGFKGFSTQCWETSLHEGEVYDMVYTCGPELMMFNAFKLAQKKKIPYEACLADRYFKCAIGLCGQCSVDPTGLRLCIDGPVFNQDQLALITDFGKYARDKFGRKIPF